MDPFGIFDLIVDALLLVPGKPTLLERADDRFPEATKMLAREPRVDGGRPIVVAATADALVILGEKDAGSAPWERVLGITRIEETVTITVAAEHGTDERAFAFERLQVSGLLAWLNTPADRFVIAVNRILRDRR